jgi:hypothetical protein
LQPERFLEMGARFPCPIHLQQDDAADFMGFRLSRLELQGAFSHRERGGVASGVEERARQ